MQQGDLNRRAAARCERLMQDAELHRVNAERCESGAIVVDCGVRAVGGLEAGRALAEVCLADRGRVEVASASPVIPGLPAVTVQTDSPLAACMASQYAGWQVALDGFFGMGSGPMRAAYGGEAIFEEIDHRESPAQVVGVLETSKLPDDEVCQFIASKCGVTPAHVTLLVARTASLAGTMQVVARSVETALHKMHELGFDIRQVISGFGIAPLPPVAKDDLTAIGWTNDAVLYGAEVTLWVQGSDDPLQELGPKTPSSASADHGRPFGEIFEHYDRDFYKIDPLLFSPAVVSLVNVETGNSFRFGKTDAEVLHRAFANR